MLERDNNPNIGVTGSSKLYGAFSYYGYQVFLDILGIKIDQMVFFLYLFGSMGLGHNLSCFLWGINFLIKNGSVP